jgi:hypothetical protein
MGNLHTSSGIIDNNTGITPREFFTTYLPWAFRGLAPGKSTTRRLSGISLTVQVHVTGEQGGDFWISLDGEKGLEVINDTVREALLTLEFPDTFLTGRPGAARVVLDDALSPPPALTASGISRFKQRLADLDSISGMMELEFVNEQAPQGNSVFRIKFNEASSPSFKISGEASTIMSVISGDMNPVQGFISGKFKLQGDIPFAMKLQRLMPV